MDLDEDQLVDLTQTDWNDIIEPVDAKDIRRMMNEIAVNEIVLGVPYDFADNILLYDSSCYDQTVSREPESLSLFTTANERREIFVSFDNDCYFIDTSLSQADEVKKFHVSTFNEQFHQPMGEDLLLGQQDSNDDLYQIFSGPKAENRQQHIRNLEEALSSRRAVIVKDNLLPAYTAVRPTYPVSWSFPSASVFNLACVKKKLTSPGSSPYVQRDSACHQSIGQPYQPLIQFDAIGASHHLSPKEEEIESSTLWSVYCGPGAASRKAKMPLLSHCVRSRTSFH